MKRESITTKTVKGSFWSVSSNILSRAGALIFTIIIARFLLPEGFGIYSLATSVALIFLTFADLGINQTFIKYVSSNLNNKKIARSYFKYIFRLKIILTIVVSSLILILSYPLAYYFFDKPSLFFPLILCSLYVFLFSLQSFFESALYISHKTFYLNAKEIIFQLSRIILSLVAFALTIRAYYVSGVIIVLIISMLLITFYCYYYYKKFLPFLFSKNDSSIIINKREVLSFLGYLTIGGISGVFFSYIDTVMLGVFVSSEYVGFYRAGYTLVFGLSGVLALHQVFLAVFSESSKASLENNFNRVLKYLLIIAIPAALGLLVLGGPIIKLVYGDDYSGAILIFQFLSPLIIPGILTSFFIPVLASRGQSKSFAKSIIAAMVMNIVLNFIFIIQLLKISQEWATIGAGIATLISTFFYIFLLIGSINKSLGIKSNFSIILKPLVAGTVMTLALLYAYSKFSEVGGLETVILALIGLIVYSLVLLLVRGSSFAEITSFKKMIMK
ncbi:MAG: flippase [Nanoarchaeota archaeon]